MPNAAKPQGSADSHAIMNKFDDFIETADKDLEVDTSTRASTGSMTPPNLTSPSKGISEDILNKKREIGEASRPHPHQRQFTPRSLSHQDHPLKEIRRRPTNSSLSVPRSNRRSLIQPIVAPKTPENHSIKYNNSAPPTLVVERRTHAERKRSESNASVRSQLSGSNLGALDDEQDVSTLLQNLANKELEILDGKHRIEELKKQLASEELVYEERMRDLRELKVQVTNHFQKANEVNNGVSSPTIKDKPASITRDAENKTPPNRKLADQNSNNMSKIDSDREERQSVWSKPLAIFSQFDQIIQHELERSLNWDEEPQKSDGPQTGLRQNKQDGETSGVTKSIWNFVSDMKSGLLGIDEEDDRDEERQKVSENGKSSDLKRGNKRPVGLGINDFKRAAETNSEELPLANDNKLRFVGAEMSADDDEHMSAEEMQSYGKYPVFDT